MSELVSVLTDVLLRRVRDVAGNAHSRSFVRDRLSDCQRIINLALNLVTETTTLTTNPYQSFYQISTLLPDSSRVLAVRENGRDCAKIADFKQFRHLDTQWFRRVGGRFEGWTQVGRDMLVLYPVKVETSSVSVVSTKLTTALSGEGTATDVPDEYHEHVLKLAQIVLLIKQRDLASAQPLIKALVDDLAPDMKAERFHLFAGGLGQVVKPNE